MAGQHPHRCYYTSYGARQQVRPFLERYMGVNKTHMVSKQNKEGREPFNIALVLAATILASGLVIAALLVVSPRKLSQTSPVLIAVPPSNTSVADQTIYQLKKQFGTKAYYFDGQYRTVESISVDKCKLSSDASGKYQIDVDYQIVWKPGPILCSSFVLRRDECGYFSSSDVPIYLDRDSEQVVRVIVK